MEQIMNIQEQEERDFYRDSTSDVDKYDAVLHAYNSGDTTHQWILSDRDCWYKNPYYVGPDQPHPESFRHDDDGYDVCVTCGVDTDNGVLHHRVGCPELEYDRYEAAQLQRLHEEHDGDWDDIPF